MSSFLSANLLSVTTNQNGQNHGVREHPQMRARDSTGSLSGKGRLLYSNDNVLYCLPAEHHQAVVIKGTKTKDANAISGQEGKLYGDRFKISSKNNLGVVWGSFVNEKSIDTYIELSSISMMLKHSSAGPLIDYTLDLGLEVGSAAEKLQVAASNDNDQNVVMNLAFISKPW